MTAQPEALRLADYIDQPLNNPNDVADAVSAELRRLAAENLLLASLTDKLRVAWRDEVHSLIKDKDQLEAQRNALKQTLHDELAGNLRLRDLGGARPDEPMLTFLERIIAERDALLRALKSTGLFLHHCWCDVQMNDYSFEKLNRQMEIVDAAIKAVEEGE